MNIKQSIAYGFIAVILALAFTACSKSGTSAGSGGGGKSLNSATELKEYLDKQPANSPDNPIKVAMKANDAMLKNIATVINDAGKYVSLDLSGSPLTEIPGWAFQGCTPLVGITIPNGVTGIDVFAFQYCNNLAGITMPNSVTYIAENAFDRCTSLSSVTIPNSVTEIVYDAFQGCTSLISVTFQGTIASDNFGSRYSSPFSGDLKEKYLAGGIGTYTTTAPVGDNSKWTKQ